LICDHSKQLSDEQDLILKIQLQSTDRVNCILGHFIIKDPILASYLGYNDISNMSDLSCNITTSFLRLQRLYLLRDIYVSPW
jgi:hypothetical protein